MVILKILHMNTMQKISEFLVRSKLKTLHFFEVGVRFLKFRRSLLYASQ